MRVELRCRCGAELVLDDVQSHTLVGLPVLGTFLSQHEKCPYKGELPEYMPGPAPSVYDRIPWDLKTTVEPPKLETVCKDTPHA